MATYKKPIISQEYLFRWEPERKFVFFITQGAHISGTAMKNLFEVNPQVVEKLQKLVAMDKPTIGTAIQVKDTGDYVFIVSRKHYSSKHDLDLVSSALAKLEGTYKMSNEDFPTIVELVSARFPNVDLRTSTKKQEHLLGYEEIEWTPPVAANIDIDL
jgi:hypothetical protein